MSQGLDANGLPLWRMSVQRVGPYVNYHVVTGRPGVSTYLRFDISTRKVVRNTLAGASSRFLASLRADSQRNAATALVAYDACSDAQKAADDANKIVAQLCNDAHGGGGNPIGDGGAAACVGAVAAAAAAMANATNVCAASQTAPTPPQPCSPLACQLSYGPGSGCDSTGSCTLPPPSAGGTSDGCYDDYECPTGAACEAQTCVLEAGG
jgi:hypothetical protein